MSIRPVKRLIKAKPTLEGAGVHLRRAFGFGTTADFDPFLLLDDFRNDRPEAYRAGFPWHPHRGIETITYVLAGTVEHGDSLGHQGAIAAGDVQWMTAGRGIIHQEMPQGDPAGRMHGFQLWANLPAALKMTAPRYQEVQAKDIPQITDDDGTEVRVVCGNIGSLLVYQLMFSSISFPGPRAGGPREFSRDFETMATVFQVFSVVMAVALSALCGWIIWRLVSKPIAAEFRS
jgi:redox-sensitive bicupin YhaK (pirin superfamily)